MSYATSAKATKTKAAKSQEASSKATKAKASKSYSMSYCERSECVDPNVPRFIVDSSVDVGDTLLHAGPDFQRDADVIATRSKIAGTIHHSTHNWAIRNDLLTRRLQVPTFRLNLVHVVSNVMVVIIMIIRLQIHSFMVE